MFLYISASPRLRRQRSLRQSKFQDHRHDREPARACNLTGCITGRGGHELRRHECVIRAGLGRNEWAIVIHFPGASEALARSSVVRLQGTRKEANSVPHNAYATG